MTAIKSRSPAPAPPNKDLERFEKKTEVLFFVLALAVIPLVGATLADDWHGSHIVAQVALLAITATFILELGYRTYLSGVGVAYLWRNWFDVLIVALSVVVSIPQLEKTLGFARSVRALRILRLTKAAPFVARAGRDAVALLERRGLLWVLLAFVVAIFISTGLFVIFEEPSGDFHGLWTGLYWTIATVTTVGGTDDNPESSRGKALAAFVMFVGITFVAWFTANVAAFLVERGGVANSGATPDELMKKLDSMEAEIKALHDAHPREP